MIAQISELHRRNQEHLLRRERLWRGPMITKPQQIEAPIAIKPPEPKVVIARVKVPHVKVIDVLAAKEERIRQLELDLADAQARILSQAELICAFDSVEMNSPIPRRPVSVIIAEVLADFPGITWNDIKGVRRRRDLIRPRHLCMYAVYTERNDLSLPLVGKIFGGKDHSTIHHAVHKIHMEKTTSASNHEGK